MNDKMGKVALISTVGEADQGVITAETYQKTAVLPFLKHHTAQDASIHTFLKELKRLRLRPSEVAMDMLIIATSMYAADIRIEREKFGEDCWTRIIDLYIPVCDTTLWNKHKKLLEGIFRFLTGDIWTIYFRDRADKELLLSPRSNRSRYKMPYKTDTVCLFSGGMDSFIGAINLLESGVTPLLLGHAKSADVSPYQDTCVTALKNVYNKMPPEKIYAFIKIPKGNLFDSEENTERGRSFMFLSLGAICASSLSAKSNLYVPENGMISLNIPLTPLRVGSHSTRTTHPQYFQMMQELFDGLGLGVSIVNPFQFKTKGEMLSECLNQQLVVDTETMSCSHPSGRYEGLGNGHCGYCVPCIIRQASFKAAGLKDKFPYRKDIYSRYLQIDKAEGADILAFKYMVAKVNKQPKYLTAAIRLTGQLPGDVAGFIDVYSRALREVNELIKDVKLT